MYKEIIINNQERIKNINLFKRDFVFDLELLKLNKIVTFVWPRRAWKTYIMYQVLKELVENHIIDLRQIVFIDFS
jgi:predicted AAA+ superfamily ATPase